MSPRSTRSQASRPSAETTFEQVKKEVAERNRRAHESARKLRDADERERAEKRRRLDLG